MTRVPRPPEDTAAALAGAGCGPATSAASTPTGDLHYVGRSKEMIKTGGFSVDPAEVENAILEREEVAEAAVVGVADEHWGEEVVAFVVFRQGAELAAKELTDSCRGATRRLQAAEADPDPARTLPKNPTGKVERGALRERAAKADETLSRKGAGGPAALAF